MQGPGSQRRRKQSAGLAGGLDRAQREQALGGSASLKGVSSVEWQEEGEQKSQMSLGQNWKGSVPESLSGALLG